MSTAVLSSTIYAEEMSKDMVSLENNHDVNVIGSSFYGIKVQFRKSRTEAVRDEISTLATHMNWFAASLWEGHAVFFFNSDDTSMMDAYAKTIGCFCSDTQVKVTGGRYFAIHSRMILKTYCCWRAASSNAILYRLKPDGVHKLKNASLGDHKPESFLFS